MLLSSLFFSTFHDYKGRQKLFSVKKMISTNERREEHPFAGLNTQQLGTAGSTKYSRALQSKNYDLQLLFYHNQ